MRISGRFNGPPDSGHGGVACGVFAAAIDPRAATVRLLSPPPMDVELTTEADGDAVTVSGPTGPIAHVAAADAVEVKPLPWLSETQVEAAQDHWIANQWPDHAFPSCFGCGHLRPDGDGLELYGGTVPDMDLAAAYWTPDASLSENGRVADWAVWAAVDCPSGGAVIGELPEGGVPVLLSSSNREFLVAGGVVWGCGFEHGQDEVAAALCDADHGGVVLLAFGPFALVVGLRVRVVLRRDERGEEHGVLEPVVPSSGLERSVDRFA